MRHDSFTCETWLIRRMYVLRSESRHAFLRRTARCSKRCLESIRCLEFLGYLKRNNMTHSNMRHDSPTYETWLIRYLEFLGYLERIDMAHSNMRHDSFTYETWLTHVWDMTHSVFRIHSCLDFWKTWSCIQSLAVDRVTRDAYVRRDSLE